MKKIIFVLLSLVYFSTVKAQIPNFEWVKQIETNWASFSYDIQLDSLGNIYTVGNFLGTTDFDPGLGVYNLTALGSCDAYVSKLDPLGNFIWAKRIGDVNNDYAYTVKIDKQNNVYIGGSSTGTVDFDPGSGIHNLTSSNDKPFILKLNPNGDFIWANQMNSYYFSVDQNSNVISSQTFGGVYDFDPGPGTYTISAVYNNIGISKLDSAGNFLWATAYGVSIVPAFIEVDGITTDSNGNIYTIGIFDGTFDFDPGAAVVTLSCSGTNDMFISKFNAYGNFVWVKQFTSTTTFNKINSIEVDKKSNVYTTGYYTNTVDFDPGSATHYLNSTTTLGAETFVSKLDSSGNFVLAKSMGGSDLDAGQTIAVDESENIYTTGYFRGTSDFDPGTGVYNLNASWPADIFISKLNPQGNFTWAFKMGGAGSDYGYSNIIDKTGNMYTTGWFQDSVDFDPSSNSFYLMATPNGYTGYIHKISHLDVSVKEINNIIDTNLFPNPTTGILNITSTYLNKKVNMEIYNSLGTLVNEIKLEETKTINLSGLSNGIYFIKIISDDLLVKTLKIIKQ